MVTRKAAPPQASPEQAPQGERKSISARYESIAEQHQLPAFAEMNAEFDLDTIDQNAPHLIKEVTKRMYERFEIFKKILETLVQPDASIISMQEAETLSAEEHERTQDLVRRLMLLDRELLLAELHNTDDAHAAFIRNGAKEWASIKRELEPLIRKLQDAWKEARVSRKFQQHYMG
jgi:hypothetical protein